MDSRAAEREFERFRRTGDPAALARVFDELAPELLLVAAHLVREPSEAEDLVQRTFVAAIESARLWDPSRRLVPWLVGILAHRARQERARSARELDPERLHASASSDPHEEAQRTEFAETIARRIAELPPHYRTVLRLRLLHGLSSTEIAHTTGESPETVKTRLRRGLDALRQSLPAGFASALGVFELDGRGLDAVRAAVLEQAGAAAGATSTLGALLGPSAAMKLFAISVAAAAALCVWAIWPSAVRGPAGAPNGAAPLEVADAPAQEERSAPVEGERRATAEAPRATLAASSARSAVVARYLARMRGRLLSPEGAPAAGVPIGLWAFDASQALARDLSSAPELAFEPEVELATTDAEGRFEFADLDPRRPLALHAAEGSACATVFPIDRAPRAGETLDLGDLQLSKRCTVTGRVVDEQGAPVAGAWVRALQRDASPFLSADHLDGLPLARLDPRALVVWQREGASELSVIELPPWIEALARSLEIPHATSDTEGRFVLGGVEPRAGVVIASKAGALPRVQALGELDLERGTELADLVLGAGRTLRGRVLGPAGAPLPGQDLWLGPQSSRGRRVHFLQHAGTTDADGRFELAGQGDEPVFVALRSSAGAPWIARGPYPSSDEIVVALGDRYALTLEVPAPPPATPLTLDLRCGEAGGELLSLGLAPRVSTEPERSGDGRWTYSELHAGRYTLLARAEGCLPFQESFVLDADRTLIIRLVPALSLELRVVERSGEAIAGAALFAQASEPLDWMRTRLPSSIGAAHWDTLPLASARSDADGRARLAPVPQSGARLVVTHPGFSTWSGALDESLAKREIVLEPCGAIAGTVLFDGEPVREPRVLSVEQLEDASGFVVPTATRRTMTTGDGNFRVGELSAGKYRVRIDEARTAASPFAVASRSLVEAWPASNVLREVVVEPGAEAFVYLEERTSRAAPDQDALIVHGRITRNGEPATGVEVALISNDAYAGAGAYEALAAMVGADGRYSIDALRAPVVSGNVHFMLRKRGGEVTLYAQTLAIPAGSRDFVHDVALEVGTLRGSVLDRTGQPVACKINAQRREGEVGAMMLVDTEADGSFLIEDVPVGRYDIQAFSRAGNVSLEGFEVRRGENRPKITFLEYCHVAGRVDLSHISPARGKPISVMLEFVDGPVNWRPSGRVDATTGKFRIGEDVAADEYIVHVVCDGVWWRHPGTVKILPGEAEDLWIQPVPGAAPSELGPVPSGFDDSPTGG